jgi:hypothetical protein
MVKVQSISLQSLFEKKLKIPEYQRPYVWSNIEIDKLIYQFREHLNRNVARGDKPNFYLGSIVLHKEGDHFNIIDGQQRTTTLQVLGLLKELQFNETEYSHPITLKNVKINYDYYKSQDFQLINYDSINVTVVITESEDMAYNFFETLNTGGKRLGGTDILKAHHLRCIDLVEKRNSFALKWEKRQKNLEVVNRMLSKIRRLDYLNKHSFIPDKFTNDSAWKNVLTEDFADKTQKNNRDIGYSFVEIEENTHTITADKYAIRQPLNQGINYINYLLNFTNDYNFLFDINESKKDKYAKFNKDIINVIDGTVDLRHYYQVALLCFVDRFGRKNVMEFSLYLFRYIYSLRLKDQTRIYETTVVNFINDNKILERILNSFTYEEILNYFKNYKVVINTNDLKGVKLRYYDRVNSFFNKTITKENFDADLKKAIVNYLNN